MTPRLRRNAVAFSGASVSALILAASLMPASASAQAFGSMVSMQAGQVTLKDGTVSQWTGANRPTTSVGTDGRPIMTIQQTQQKALMDWQKFQLQAGEVLEFQQQQADWIAVNRVHGTDAALVNGEIRAKGRVFILNDNGVLVSKDAVINTRQLVTGKGVSDVTVQGATTTIVQSGPKSLLEWRGDLSLQAGEVLRVEQKKNSLLNDLSNTNDWILMNRYVGGVARIDGTIESKGQIYLIAPEGLVFNGKLTAQQAVLSQLNMSDAQFDLGMLAELSPGNARNYPQFSNLFMGDSSGNPYFDAPIPVDPNDPARYNMTIGANGVVTTGTLGKILLFGNNVVNRGLLHAKDGQIIMGAGEQIWLSATNQNYGTERPDIIYASAGTHTPYGYRNVDIPYYWRPSPGDPARSVAEAQALYLSYQERRRKLIGFTVENDGEVLSERGRIDLLGFNLRQMGAMGATSTALFKGAINFDAFMRDDPNNYDGYSGPLLGGNGSVVFGEGSITTILPDLESKDAISLATYLAASADSELRLVGKLVIKARTVDMQRNSLVYMPGGMFYAALDAGIHIFGTRGNGANQENEDGSRFFMDTGAAVDLSGWSDTVVDMESNVVSGRLFISQLRDSPLQRNGPLYRKLISVDRRYGTPFADWSSFDNLTTIGIDQIIVDGGVFRVDVANDFIMKSGASIDVSGGKTTYKAGFLYTTLLRTMDNKIIDIREADPDELYMGLANEFTINDSKWGQQSTYYIPLVSSQVGRYEESYIEGGRGGLIDILGPDMVLNGTMKGDVVTGKYQRATPPKGGQLFLNQGGLDEGEYRGNHVLIEAVERVLDDSFVFDSDLSEKFGDFFGDEIAIGETQGGRRYDNGTLLSEDFFNRSSMGSYYVEQTVRYNDANSNPAIPVNVVEAGVDLNLRNGASLELAFGDDTLFLGSVRTEGGDVEIATTGRLTFASNTVIDTRGSWTSDREQLDEVPIDTLPRIDGGDVIITVGQRMADLNPNAGLFIDGLIMPDGMKIDTSGGGWVSRAGVLKGGKGGAITISAAIPVADTSLLDLSADLTAWGLGGAGALKLSLFNDDIRIGGEPSEASADERFYYIDPSFFTDAAFSSISISGRSLHIADGVTIDAIPLTTVLKSEYQGLSPIYAPTGTALADLIELKRLAPQDRASAVRKGMTLNFSAEPVALAVSSTGFRLGEGALIRTQDGGAINISGRDVVIDGSIVAPGGAIGVSGKISLGSEALLSARGVAQTLNRKVGPGGVELIDGVVLAGGLISLSGLQVSIAEGAVLDVSGTSAQFDVPDYIDASGAVVRVRKTVSSAGGAIDISATRLDIDKATYHADSGGVASRGGSFSLTYRPPILPAAGGTTVAQVVTAITNLRSNLYYKNGTRVPTTANVFDLDLSQIDWNRRYANSGITFPPGFKLQSSQWLTDYLNTFEIASLGNPQVLLIGTDVPAGVGMELPTIAPFDPVLRLLINRASASYAIKSAATTPNEIARFSPEALSNGGFSSVSLTSSTGIRFAGPVTIGTRRADGSALFDKITLTTPTIFSGADTQVNLTASTILLTTTAGGGAAVSNSARLSSLGLGRVSNSAITFDAGSSLLFDGMAFHGFGDVNLYSRGDVAGDGRIYTPGRLTLKADQVYATAAMIRVGSQAAGPVVTFESGDTLSVLAAFEGPKKPSPFEAGGTLNLIGPRIVQGGVLRSPLGAINLTAINDGTVGAGTITLLPGSLISGGADGRLIPWGTTSNGDTWRGPNGQEIATLPEKAVRFTADNLDLQEGAVIDVSGGGDLYAWEFISGVGGTYDWLTGYRDENNKWVADASEIYAVVPSYDAGLGTDVADVGRKIYLSGGSGLPAGYYTLLPARFAMLPGAFRVTAKHGKGNFADMVLGSRQDLTDGSTIQAGYVLEGGTPYRDQRTNGYMVMPGSTLRTRSQYVETLANQFFQSEAFLKKALRTNLNLGSPPRAPKDGGSVVLSANKTLNLGATLKSAGVDGGRGGFADINAPKIAIVGPGDTSVSYGSDYLLLDATKLSSFGAESLLIGGLRRQGANGIEIDVNASDVVVSNQGSVLYGPEIILAAGDRVLIEDGAKIEVRGKIGGSSGDLSMVSFYDQVIDTKGTVSTTDDVVVNAAIDKGALVRLSSDSLVNILRDPSAVDAMETLLSTPGALAALNAQRAALGLPAIVTGPGVVIEGGASLTGATSLVLDATRDLTLSGAAVLDTKELSAASSLITIGDVTGVTHGLTFGQGSLGALGNINTLVLKSYSTIDFVGPVDLKATGKLSLDAREIRSRDGAAGDVVTITADEVRLANSDNAAAPLAGGNGSLMVKARNIVLGAGNVALSGFGDVDLQATERVIGRGFGTVRVAGTLDISAASVTAESGAQLTLDALGDVKVTANSNTGTLPVFSTLGATLNLIGASVTNEGKIKLTSGTVGLRARNGDITLGSASVIDVTGDVSTIYDSKTAADAGVVNLVSDQGGVITQAGSLIDVSGATDGSNAGTLRISALNDVADLRGELRGSARPGYRGGSFELSSESIADFGALGAKLNQSGFSHSRRFRVAQGDLIVSGETQVQNFSATTDNGSITVTGVIRSSGDAGGSIYLAAAEDLTLASGSQLIVKANKSGESGGRVVLETAGRNGGEISLRSGSLIDVSGEGEGARTVRLRAPRVGSDVAIAEASGSIVGARSVLAEAYRVYDNVPVIDQAVINQVTADADAFMAGSAAIRLRLGNGIQLAPGIELRSTDDMVLKTAWNLNTMRYNGAAGVLTLRAAGDLRFDANLSDGFTTATRTGELTDGASWTFALVGGADLDSANSTAVQPEGRLAQGKGSLIVGGIADTIDYFLRPDGVTKILYRKDPSTGLYLRTCGAACTASPYDRYVELTWSVALNTYVDPISGDAIARDPVTGDFLETAEFGARELPLVFNNAGGYSPIAQPTNPAGIQVDRSDGWFVRTGTGSIIVAAGRDVVFEQKASSLYTAGEQSDAVDGFDAPTGQSSGSAFVPFVAYYPEHGGDVSIRAQGDIVGGGSDQFPSAWLWRLGLAEGAGGTFSGGTSGRPYEQSTWFVKFSAYKAGIGALGGGNVTLEAGGDIVDASVNIASTGRVAGNRFVGDMPATLVMTGGGNLTVDAGGDILSGVYYVGDGTAELNAGGIFGTGRTITALFARAIGYQPVVPLVSSQDIYPMLFTTSSQFRLRSGGDLNIEAVLDALSGTPAADNGYKPFNYRTSSPNSNGGERPGFGWFQSYQSDASVTLFSAGGDVTFWNNSWVVTAKNTLGMLNEANPAPLVLGNGDYGPYYAGGNNVGSIGAVTIQHYLWPSKVAAVAAAGDIIVRGGFTMFPAADGNLELLARDNVFLDLVYQTDQPVTPNGAAARQLKQLSDNWLTASTSIVMSQSDPLLVPNPLRPQWSNYNSLQAGIYLVAGLTNTGALLQFSDTNTPTLHVGDEDPVRIYAGSGDIFMNRFGRGTTGSVSFPKAAWLYAGDDIYFPNFVTQHNNENDISLYRAGDNIFFAKTSTLQVNGPGRLEIEAGRDIYIPEQTNGIQTSRIRLLANQYDTTGVVWRTDYKAADIAISTGFNQRPEYAAFEAQYLDPDKVGEGPDYVLTDLGDGRKLSMYLIDQVYDRAGGPDQEFPTEAREGLVNFVRRLQGLQPLKEKAAQLAYLDKAWAYFKALPVDRKTPFYRNVFYLEQRTAGREANDPNSDRFGSANRGYDVIAALFPGAEKASDATLATGESRWAGDFETYASVVKSNGGGDITFMIPGGGFKLSNSLYAPPLNNPGFDPRTAGVLTLEGGEINLFAHNSVILNESRILTAKGGNVMIWSSYGDIAAGRGAKTAISPPNYSFRLEPTGTARREPGGLPSGAGIGTLATVTGTPPADVDLVAPNGIVDAGDAGIRVSGNFNVFAVQILGADNIEVGGVSTGLPQPPAQPPNALDVGDAAAKAADVADALGESIRRARADAGVLTPSIIEVRIVPPGAQEEEEEERREGQRPRAAMSAPTRDLKTQVSDRPAGNEIYTFNLPPQPLNDALRAVSRQTGASLVYDSAAVGERYSRGVRGRMTAEQALEVLLLDAGVVIEKTGPKTILLRKISSIAR